MLTILLLIGHGVSALYLDRTKVTKYVAVEPNVAMHDHIRRTAASAGFAEDDGSLVVLGCGIEDVEDSADGSRRRERGRG